MQNGREESDQDYQRLDLSGKESGAPTSAKGDFGGDKKFVMSQARLRLKIFGQVQGVNFRYYLSEFARGLHLKGWVRNLSDGCVECLAEGEKGDLTALLAWAEKGTRWARVEKVEADWGVAMGEFSSFEIRY